MATAPHLQMDSSDVEHEGIMYMYSFSLHLSIPQKQKKKQEHIKYLRAFLFTHLLQYSSFVLQELSCLTVFLLFSNEIIPNRVSAQTFFNP